MSLGRLVHEHKCRFEWVPGRRPILTLPNGVRIKLSVRRHVPYLPHDIAELCESFDPALVSSEGEPESEVEAGHCTDEEPEDEPADFTSDHESEEDLADDQARRESETDLAMCPR